MMTEKNKGGRPATVLTEDQLQQLEKLAAVLTTEQIADLFGIGRSTFFKVMERDEQVSRLYKKGRAKSIAEVSKNLVQKALEGDNAAMMFYLKTQAGWKETQVVEATVTEKKGFNDFYDDK